MYLLKKLFGFGEKNIFVDETEFPSASVCRPLITIFIWMLVLEAFPQSLKTITTKWHTLLRINLASIVTISSVERFICRFLRDSRSLDSHHFLYVSIVDFLTWLTASHGGDDFAVIFLPTLSFFSFLFPLLLLNVPVFRCLPSILGPLIPSSARLQLQSSWGGKIRNSDISVTSSGQRKYSLGFSRVSPVTITH